MHTCTQLILHRICPPYTLLSTFSFIRSQNEKSCGVLQHTISFPWYDIDSRFTIHLLHCRHSSVEEPNEWQETGPLTPQKCTAIHPCPFLNKQEHTSIILPGEIQVLPRKESDADISPLFCCESFSSVTQGARGSTFGNSHKAVYRASIRWKPWKNVRPASFVVRSDLIEPPLGELTFF